MLLVWETTHLPGNLQPVKGLHELIMKRDSSGLSSVCRLHSLISMKSCLFSTMALPRLLPSSIILRHIRQQSVQRLQVTLPNNTAQNHCK